MATVFHFRDGCHGNENHCYGNCNFISKWKNVAIATRMDRRVGLIILWSPIRNVDFVLHCPETGCAAWRRRQRNRTQSPIHAWIVLPLEKAKVDGLFPKVCPPYFTESFSEWSCCVWNGRSFPFIPQNSLTLTRLWCCRRGVMAAFLLRILQKAGFFGRRTSESGIKWASTPPAEESALLILIFESCLFHCERD